MSGKEKKLYKITQRVKKERKFSALSTDSVLVSDKDEIFINEYPVAFIIGSGFQFDKDSGENLYTTYYDNYRVEKL